jgi:uncharacterized membrane protein YdjX (TVP38/TMEM64 family)
MHNRPFAISFPMTYFISIMSLHQPNELVTEEETPMLPSESRCKSRTILTNPKLWIGLTLLGLLTYTMVDTFTTGYVKTLLGQLLDFIQQLGFAGAVLFTALYVVATVLLIPGTILTLGAGFIFTSTHSGNQLVGTAIAAAVVFIGASAGAVLAFLLARFILQDTAVHLREKYQSFRAIDKAIEGNGFKITFLLRLSPALPFNVLNYLMGTTSVSLKEYSLALFGILPGSIAYCFIGSTFSNFSEVMVSGNVEQSASQRVVRIAVLVVGIVATILAVALVTFYARRELKKYVVDEEDRAMETSINQPNIP